MNFGEDDTTITTLIEQRPCLCGHQYRHHSASSCNVCTCDRFCASVPPSAFFEGDMDLLRDLT